MTTKLNSLILIFLFLISQALPASAQQPPFKTKPNPWQGVDYMPGEVIIKYREDVPDNARQGLAARLGLHQMRRNARLGINRYRLPAGRRMKDFIEECRKDPNIEYVEPNYKVHLHYTPNDEWFPYQWNFDSSGTGGIHMRNAWNVNRGGNPGVVVAIVDTGIAYEDYTDVINSFRSEEYYQAPELSQTSFAPGYDFVDNDDHPNDDYGHGTHVAGTIAQNTNNFAGAAGIAFKTTLMPVKVINANGYGSSFDVADGIIWAADNGADIINLSLGSRFSSTAIRNACQYAHERGVTLVCSAGNDSRDEVGYPARYGEYCIAVGATRYDETRAFYSNWGAELDIMAPGGDLNVDQNGDGILDGVLQQSFLPEDRSTFNYYLYQGTSMSAPHVSGVAALLIAAGVATTPDEIRAALQNTAKDLGAPGWDPDTGWGLLDAEAALKYSGGSPPPVNNPPQADPGGPYTGISGQSVGFDGRDSSDPDGDPLTYLWDFGDGISGAGATPQHSYSAAGTYTVSLTVNDGQASSAAATTTAAITGANQAPSADAGGPYSGDAGESITFNASGSFDPDGTISSYAWNFGDGTGGSGVSVQHAYATAGNYTVSVTVTANDGATDSDTATVNVADVTPPGGSVEVFTDGFENGEWNGLWTEDGQSDWQDSFIRSSEGRYSANVDGPTENGALTSVAISLAGHDNATVEFTWLIRSYLDLGEYIAFDISTDNGQSWQEMRRLSGDVDPEDAWITESVQVTGISQLQLRFRGLMNFGSEDGHVDDVHVTAW